MDGMGWMDGWMDGWLSLYDGLLRAPTVLIINISHIVGSWGLPWIVKLSVFKLGNKQMLTVQPNFDNQLKYF